MDKVHTFELPAVNKAVENLISDNFEHLISWIYQNNTIVPYNDPKIRAGLSLKIVIKCTEDTVVPVHLMKKIIRDSLNTAVSQEKGILIEELPVINKAVENLMSDNSEHLISWIYQNDTIVPYNDPRIRVGLSLKILIKCTEGTVAPVHLMEKIIQDIVNLLTIANPQERSVLIEELRLVQKCTELDDLISLNLN
jgi:hypothetical protein